MFLTHFFGVLFILFYLLYFWIIRKNLILIWKLGGFKGSLKQIGISLFIWKFMNPEKILENIQKVRSFVARPMATIFGTKCFVYIDDPISAEVILTSNDCVDKTILSNGFFAKNGLLHAAGQKWKERRRQLNPTFRHNILLSFFPTFNTIGDSLQTKFTEMIGKKKLNEIEDVLNRAVLVAACQTTMGTETNFLENDEFEISQTYKTLLNLSALKAHRPWLQLKWILKLTKYYKSDNENTIKVNEFVRNMVKNKHDEWKTRNRESKIPEAEVESNDDIKKKKRIFIDQIFHLAESGEITLQDIQDEANSMILVAFETVSNSLLLLVLCLAMYPETQTKLREEIRTTFPSGNVSDITVEDLKDMKYLDMVVNEGLRFLSTIPLAARYASNDFILRDDIIIPKDSIVLIDVFNMHRDPKIWGPKANDFYPEHFLPENIAKRHPYSYIPFLKGIRYCIGYRYSLLLSKVLLIKLIHSYQFETNTKLDDLKLLEGISLKIKNSSQIILNISKVFDSNVVNNNKV